MPRIGRGFVACISTAFAAVVVEKAAAAQWTPMLWVDLVQMPVAVARLDLAGVPHADLRLLVPSLNTRDVSPTLFIESVRGIRLLDGWDSDRLNREVPGMGGYVRRLHDVGLRGPQLAGAIQRELRTRGVPAGPKSARGSDVFSRGFLPSDVDEPSSGPGPSWGTEFATGRARGRAVGASRPELVPRARGGAQGTPSAGSGGRGRARGGGVGGPDKAGRGSSTSRGRGIGG